MAELSEIRCPVCNAMHGKMLFGLIQIKCRKCNFEFKHRVDVPETAGIARESSQKPPSGD